MRLKSQKLFLFLLVSCLFSVTARAQTYAGVPVNIIIPEVLILENAVSPPLNFNFNSTNALDNGIVITGTTLTYYSNKPWYVTIKAGSANFSGGDGMMPASVLKFKNSTNTTFTDLSTTPKSLLGSTGAKNGRGIGTIGVDFKMDPGYLNPPANNYSITVTYTISNL